MRCEDVELLRDDDGNPRGGARLVVGKARSDPLGGDSKWTDLSCEFEVTEYRRDVELRLELRARDGKAWFRIRSLAIQQIEAR